jgi:hypothetical protein
MIVVPGDSQLFSSTVDEPGVCVKMILDLRHSSLAESTTWNSQPSSCAKWDGEGDRHFLVVLLPFAAQLLGRVYNVELTSELLGRSGRKWKVGRGPEEARAAARWKTGRGVMQGQAEEGSNPAGARGRSCSREASGGKR